MLFMCLCSMSARPMVVAEYGCFSLSSDNFTDDTISMPASMMVSAVSVNMVMNSDINAVINVIVQFAISAKIRKNCGILSIYMLIGKCKYNIYVLQLHCNYNMSHLCFCSAFRRVCESQLHTLSSKAQNLSL